MAKPKPSRRVLIAARTITAIVSWGLAEGVLAFGGYPDWWWGLDPNWTGATSERGFECDPELGWKLREGSFDMVWPDGRRFLYTNWSNGRRATAGSPDKYAGGQQVIFVGDSFTQGYGLNDADTLPWMVQERHPDLQVTNYASGLYGTYQSYLALKKRLEGPATVYYLFNGFHEDRNAADRNWLRVQAEPAKGCFFPYATVSGGELVESRNRGEVIWGWSRKSRVIALIQDYTIILPSYFRVRDKQRTTETILAKMNDLVRAKGGRFSVILFDMDDKQRAAYREFLTGRGIHFVDADGPERKDLQLRLSDGHPDRGLNLAVAKWIEPTVTASK